MLSMTGYGVARASSGQAQVVVETRAVNHRFLEVRARAASGLSDHVPILEEVGRARGQRGRLEISARIEGSIGGTIRLDTSRATAAMRDLAALVQQLGRSEQVPLSLLSTVPDLFVDDATRDSQGLAGTVREAVSLALDQLEAMRRTEGAALAEDLSRRLAKIDALASAVLARGDEAIDIARARLKTRIERLLRGTGVALDEARLEHEVAMLADRSDVAEELTRLQSHTSQMAALLQQESEPVGRRIEFLLQEMGREINTLGSKATDLEITSAVLELKAELERMREQAQNIL
jgi:uncharacterized protein (TIGR00255 family)